MNNKDPNDKPDDTPTPEQLRAQWLEIDVDLINDLPKCRQEAGLFDRTDIPRPLDIVKLKPDSPLVREFPELANHEFLLLARALPKNQSEEHQRCAVIAIDNYEPKNQVIKAYSANSANFEQEYFGWEGLQEKGLKEQLLKIYIFWKKEQQARVMPTFDERSDLLTESAEASVRYSNLRLREEGVAATLKEIREEIRRENKTVHELNREAYQGVSWKGGGL